MLRETEENDEEEDEEEDLIVLQKKPEIIEEETENIETAKFSQESPIKLNKSFNDPNNVDPKARTEYNRKGRI